MTIKEASEFLKSLRWQYAKTYPTAPHEYTCLEWKPDAKQQMVDFAEFIQNNGYKEQFYSKTFIVLQIGDMKYWTMDFPLENTDLINRTYVDDSKKEQIAKYVQSPDFKFKKGMTLDDIKNQEGAYETKNI